MSNERVLIIEDEKQIARFIELELTHEGYYVDIEYNGKDGLYSVQQEAPDIIILDLMLPGMNGMEICRRVRQFSEVPIIILTARDETMNKVMGLDIGANDYITKPFEIEELLARIRAALRKNNIINTQAVKNIQVEDLIMDTSMHTVKRGNNLIDLTKREYDLLEYLIRNKNIVLSRDRLMENVWGFDYAGDTNVVDVYIRYLRSKVDEAHNIKLIHTVRGVGYILKDKADEN